MLEIAGGGGYGEAASRDPELVAADVEGDYVSRAAAATDYGVALAADGTVDAAGTAALRKAPRA
ncbi:MAG: hypothetical protein R3D28_15900 [Geminicoccaceae bacterium]